MDKRAIRSRKALQDALFSLLKRKPFDEIEIQELTDEADTARVTFYRHYGTKEELLTTIVENTYQQLKRLEESIQLSFDDLLDFNQMPPTYFLFAQMEGNRTLAKNLYMSSAGILLQKFIREITVARVIASVENAPQYADLPIEMIGNHLATVTIGNIEWWLFEDAPHSAEYMAKISHWMGLSGALYMIGRADLIIMPDEDWLEAPLHQA